MAVVYKKRHVTYALLAVPILTYLVVMTCIVTQYCPRANYDRSAPDELQRRYRTLIKLFLKRVSSSNLRHDLERHQLSFEHKNLLDQETEAELTAFFQDLTPDTGMENSERKSSTQDAFHRKTKTSLDSELTARNRGGHFDLRSRPISSNEAGTEYTSDGDTKLHKEVPHSNQPPRYLYNCSTISSMRIRHQVGHGVSKQAFLADHRGRTVVIKMVTRHVQEVKWCLDKLRQARGKSQPGQPGTTGGEDDEGDYRLHKIKIDDSKGRGNDLFGTHRIKEVRQDRNSDYAGDKNSGRFRRDESRQERTREHLGGEEANAKYKVEEFSQGMKSDRNTPTSTNYGHLDKKAWSSDTHQQENPTEPHEVEITPSERQSCYIAPTARVMKEILLSQQLQHPNLAAMLGFCVRSEEAESTDISEHGVISVFELGSRFVLDNLQILPWQTRLRHAVEMASLLHYLQFSPLGSLIVPDFKEGHLVMVNDTLKLIDLDDVNNIEPECGLSTSPDKTCPYGISCSRALCEGYNAKENMKNMNRLVFKRLLFPTTFPGHVVQDIGQLNADLDSLKLTAGQLLVVLERIQHKSAQTDM